MQDDDEKPAEQTPAQIERIKLTAGYLNIIAAGLFTTCVAAPIAAYALVIWN